MTRRRRTSKATQGPMTLDERSMWACFDREDLMAEFGTLLKARAEWSRRRSLLTGAAVPEAFWALDGLGIS